MSPSQILVLGFLLYMAAGAAQLAGYPRVRRHIADQVFPSKKERLSIIVPIKSMSPSLDANMGSVCRQDYPDYEVIFVAQHDSDPAWPIAQRLSREFPHVRAILSGDHDPGRIIAKSHNLLKGIELAATGNSSLGEGWKDGSELFLFTDSDVFHPSGWAKELTAPLGNTYRGRSIDATTAIFIAGAHGFYGAFCQLSINFATFLSSFTMKRWDFPPYCSGASIAIGRKEFERFRIAEAWDWEFNDDLLAANTILNGGGTIFNVRRFPSHPTEDFETWHGMFNKFRRWSLTVGKYSHRSLFFWTIALATLNLHFQVALGIALLSLICEQFGWFWHYSHVSLAFIIAASYIYSVIFRWAVGRIVKEDIPRKYYLVTPLSHWFWSNYYLYANLVYRSFHWGGHRYDLRNRNGKSSRNKK